MLSAISSHRPRTAGRVLSLTLTLSALGLAVGASSGAGTAMGAGARHTESPSTGHRASATDVSRAYLADQARQDAARHNRQSGAGTSRLRMGQLSRGPNQQTSTSAVAPARTAALRTTSTSTNSTTTSAATTSATPSAASALVLYDNSGDYAFLGEFNAIGLANLAGHFGTVKTQPVSAYTAGQMSQYTATIYVGTTYQDATTNIPPAFTHDVMSSSKPVIWIFDNIWQLSRDNGQAAVSTKYGWDPSSTYFSGSPNTSDTYTSVSYKGQTLTRNAAAGGILPPYITDPSKVTVLATATNPSTGETKPWAVRSGNLTYIGDQPFAYVDETDRTMVLSDLLFDALAPATTEHHRALVRLEDISPASDPQELIDAANYLYSENVPFSFNIIPVYKDPNGFYNNGQPQTIKLSQAPDVVNAIKYLLNHGGSMVMEGYTHQYSNINDPYTGVSGDDFEFYLSHIDSANNVILDGPVKEDSSSWASGRINSAFKEFAAAKLPKPTQLVVPHYAASQVDYKAFVSLFKARYDRTLYFNGQLTGAKPDYSRVFGQYFPYVVKDVYGQTVVPENLGDYEPVELNNHPVRLPADIVHEAQLNLVVRDGFASFFYDASNGVQPLKDIVSGIKGLGAYAFVSSPSLVP